jgi:hypothetical protein
MKEDVMGRACSTMAKMRNVYKISVGKREGNKPIRTYAYMRRLE